MKTLTVALVLYTDGSVDSDASVEAFRASLDAHIIEQGQMNEGIAVAVEAVFDTLKGARANMPYVINEALRHIGTTPANFNLLTEKVGDFIRANANDKDPEATYHIGKGKGGGVVRLSDESEDARKKRLASADKKAEKDAK